MKFKTNLLFACFIFLSFSVFAQLNLESAKNLPTAEQYKKITKYPTVLNLHSKTNIKGLLYKVTDEMVILIPNDEYIKRYSHFVKLAKEEQIAIDIPFIQRISTRKKGKLGKSVMIGAGLGLVLGVLANSTAEGTAPSGGGVIMVPLLTRGLLGMLFGGFSKSHNLKDKAKLEKLKGMGIMSSF